MPKHSPLPPEDFKTISLALDHAAKGDGAAVFYSSRGELEHALTYRELKQRAWDMAQRLLAKGFRRGDRLGLMAETSPQFLVFFHACQYAGLIPCPLPFTLYPGGKEAYIQRLTTMAISAKLVAIIGPSPIRQCMEAAGVGLQVGGMVYEDLYAMSPDGDPQPNAPHEAAYIQYSSGSTAEPKGVLVTQQALCANVQGILRHGLKLRPSDRAFSWLPFYHDMGLVGFSIAPVFGGCSVDYLSPSTFARNPGLWLSLMSANGSTITYAPTFGYQLAARRFKPAYGSLDLSPLRVAGIGGDMIRIQALDEFTTALAGTGFRREAFQPGYGMAEAVLSITFGEVGRGPVLDSSSPSQEEYVICGRPLPGLELIITDPEGKPLPDTIIGEIRVKGPSIMAEYFSNPEATAAIMDPRGYLVTGDLGYLVEGQLVVTGRAKDLIIVRGRNIWPQDVEWTVEELASLKPGSVAAIGVERDGEEQLVVLVQCGLQEVEERQSLYRQIIEIMGETMGLTAEVIFIPPHSLPFTTSGKISRARARTLFLEGKIGNRPSGEAFHEHY